MKNKGWADRDQLWKVATGLYNLNQKYLQAIDRLSLELAEAVKVIEECVNERNEEAVAQWMEHSTDDTYARWLCRAFLEKMGKREE